MKTVDFEERTLIKARVILKALLEIICEGLTLKSKSNIIQVWEGMKRGRSIRAEIGLRIAEKDVKEHTGY